MAKALKTAALVVGAVALVATGIGAAAGLGIGLGLSAATLGTIATVATVAGVVGGVLSIAAALTAGKPPGSVGSGSATKFKIDKETGQPYIMGRTYSGGNVVHRAYYGAKNAYESWVTVHSLGPVKSMGPLEIDKVAQTFSGGSAIGQYTGSMWLQDQLGACPEGAALSGPVGAIPGWDATSKLSGYAADLWTLKFDEKGKVYPTGVPQRGRVIEGVLVYDPRQDSTYPGGSGSCRLGDESTYVYSENPALHAVTWAFGRIQNGRLVAGGGMKVTGLSLPNFVDWANVCDANGWKVGGVVYSTTDNAWDVLRMIGQAGGGEVMPVGALLSCMFSAPRVAIGTIISADVIGDIDVPCSASRRTRRNTVIPKVRLETHGWEMTPLDALVIADFVTADGGNRPKEVELPLVQQVDQGAQLGLYDIWDGRELDGIVLPLKVYMLGYLPGDCLNVDIPEADLTGRQVIVRNREIDGSSMGVTLTCRSETAGKHPFCLGRTGTTPPTPDLSVPTFYPADNRAAYQLISQTVPYPVTSDDTSITVATFTGIIDDGRSITFPAATLTGLASGTTFAVLYNLAAGTYSAVAAPAATEIASSAYVFVRWSTTSVGGEYPASPTAPGGDGGTGSSGACVTVDMLVLMADGTEKRAGDLRIGDVVRTQHETTREWDEWPITAVSIERRPYLSAPGHPDATAKHRFGIEGGWMHMDEIGQPAGEADVVRVTVAGAHTYMARHPDGDWKLSHNLKPVSE